jgi:hypothetical protein
LISTYLIIVAMFMAPVGVKFFAQTFYQGSSSAEAAQKVGVLSPFSAVFALPLNVEDETRPASNATPMTSDLTIFFGYIGWTIVYNSVLVLVMIRSFQVRWRVAD